jgi:hypothetical protein
MLGRLLVAAIAGVVAWKYRDSIREYAQGNAGPAREKLDGILGTMKDRSETLLDQAKEQISTRLDTAREKLRGGALEPGQENVPGSSFRA